jgi:hypothetical protein
MIENRVFYFDTHSNAKGHRMLMPECLLKHGQGIEERYVEDRAVPGSSTFVKLIVLPIASRH